MCVVRASSFECIKTYIKNISVMRRRYRRISDRYFRRPFNFDIERALLHFTTRVPELSFSMFSLNELFIAVINIIYHSLERKSDTLGAACIKVFVKCQLNLSYTIRVSFLLKPYERNLVYVDLWKMKKCLHVKFQTARMPVR